MGLLNIKVKSKYEDYILLEFDEYIDANNLPENTVFYGFNGFDYTVGETYTTGNEQHQIRFHNDEEDNSKWKTCKLEDIPKGSIIVIIKANHKANENV